MAKKAANLRLKLGSYKSSEPSVDSTSEVVLPTRVKIGKTPTQILSFLKVDEAIALVEASSDPKIVAAAAKSSRVAVNFAAASNRYIDDASRKVLIAKDVASNDCVLAQALLTGSALLEPASCLSTSVEIFKSYCESNGLSCNLETLYSQFCQNLAQVVKQTDQLLDPELRSYVSEIVDDLIVYIARICASRAENSPQVSNVRALVSYFTKFLAQANYNPHNFVFELATYESDQIVTPKKDRSVWIDGYLPTITYLTGLAALTALHSNAQNSCSDELVTWLLEKDGLLSAANHKKGSSLVSLIRNAFTWKVPSSCYDVIFNDACAGNENALYLLLSFVFNQEENTHIDDFLLVAKTLYPMYYDTVLVGIIYNLCAYSNLSDTQVALLISVQASVQEDPSYIKWKDTRVVESLLQRNTLSRENLLWLFRSQHPLEAARVRFVISWAKGEFAANMYDSALWEEAVAPLSFFERELSRIITFAGSTSSNQSVLDKQDLIGKTPGIISWISRCSYRLKKDYSKTITGHKALYEASDEVCKIVSLYISNRCQSAALYDTVLRLGVSWEGSIDDLIAVARGAL